MLLFGLMNGLIDGLMNGLIIGLSVGLSVGLKNVENSKIKTVELLQWTWAIMIKNILPYGLGIGLFLGLIIELSVELRYGVIFGLSGGLIGGLIGGQENIKNSKIKTVKLLQWTWVIMIKNILLYGLLLGLFFVLLYGLLFGLSGGMSFELLLGLLFVLLGGLFDGLSGGLLSGLSSKKIETKTIPNQGIKHSAKNSLLFGLFFGMIVVLNARLLLGELSDKLKFLLLSGLFFGLLGGLSNGGEAVIKHFLLRFILFFNKYMPLRYVRFLNYAVEQILLRKVGGGYIFIHRTIMEYFASLTEEDIKKIVSGID